MPLRRVVPLRATIARGAVGAVLVLAGAGACGPDGADAAEEDAGGTDDMCVSLCGCPEEVTLDYSATVIDGQTGETVADVEVYCDMETDPIAVSDDAGAVSFSVMTQESPGCGYARCDQLRFHPTDGPWEDAVVSAMNTNGEQVPLQYPPD